MNIEVNGVVHQAGSSRSSGTRINSLPSSVVSAPLPQMMSSAVTPQRLPGWASR